VQLNADWRCDTVGMSNTTLQNLAARFGSREGTVFIFETCGWRRAPCLRQLPNTGFRKAWQCPTRFSEHAGCDQLIRVMKLLNEFGLERKNVHLLTSYGPVEGARLNSIYSRVQSVRR
jgi:hypothetical protein